MVHIKVVISRFYDLEEKRTHVAQLRTHALARPPPRTPPWSGPCAQVPLHPPPEAFSVAPLLNVTASHPSTQNSKSLLTFQGQARRPPLTLGRTSRLPFPFPWPCTVPGSVGLVRLRLLKGRAGVCAPKCPARAPLPGTEQMLWDRLLSPSESCLLPPEDSAVVPCPRVLRVPGTRPLLPYSAGRLGNLSLTWSSQKMLRVWRW